ncbi:RDD family protein [Mycoplasma yeatsii]|uniref:RDD family membrane protein YckC n=1 Tax=Mycoplasma yeatsii TaxID=51365 RepID=A0ABU0NGB4_9MOLU|nr:RDD family protein [Mycoplasma yeatsii]MDQ0567944.1 putative RDD family membrane protein YckC [Mycoplasma yeatsii]
MENKKYLLVQYTDKNKKLEDNQFSLASVWKLLFARLFDLIIGSIPMVLIDLLWKSQPGDVVILLTRYLISIIWMFLYFVVLTWTLKGQSLSKKIFKLQLISLDKKPITFKDIFLRELVFIFAPFLIGMISTTIFALILPVNINNDNRFRIFISAIIYQFGLIIVFFWWLVIMISIKFQKLHQANIDIKLHLVVVDKKQQVKIQKHDFNKMLKRDEKHVSLTDQPGNFDNDFIYEIQNEEEINYNKSINLKKQDIKTLKLENQNQTKLIESEKKDEHK